MLTKTVPILVFDWSITWSRDSHHVFHLIITIMDGGSQAAGSMRYLPLLSGYPTNSIGLLHATSDAWHIS
ncbi:hypothetical protein VTN77DRAFT_9143 [Rasamsonia byssochlamydoides]|uniref:uncharacterized protein n=1 Tax=Rasamsonia byssochlamydoides TaxID=89139 RepID=UPI003742A7A8